jgi:hypothetical protein
MDDDLPVFDEPPIPLPSEISPVERLQRRQDQPTDPDIATVEALCQAGDVPAASAAISRLLESGTHAGDLQYCLLAAIVSGSEGLVRQLLEAGTSITVPNTQAAIEYKRIPILSLFLQYGWDINKEEDWCLPGLLA